MDNSFVALIHNAFAETVVNYFGTDETEITHYTSPNAFMNIMQNQELWFGNVDNVNDINEISYAYEKVIIPCVRNFKFKDETLNCSLLDRINEQRKKQNFTFCPKNAVENKRASFYLLCTCLKADSTMLWNMYSKNEYKEGFSITFDKDKLFDSFCECNGKKNSKGVHLIFEGKVEYSLQEQCKKVNEYLSCLEYNLQKNDSKEYKETVLDVFVEKFIIMSLLMKDSDFSKEEEFRIVIVANDDYLDTNKEKGAYLKFSTCKGVISSKLVFKFEKDVIKSVHISPFLNEKNAIKTTEYFLSKTGYDDVNVIQTMPKMR